MKKYIFTIFLSIFIISCGDDSSKDSKCECEVYQECVDDICVAKEGFCDNTDSCDPGWVCNEYHICEDSCENWQTFDIEQNSCVAKDGMCGEDGDCDVNEVCNIALNSCETDVEIVWGDCPNYIDYPAQCTTVQLPLDYSSDVSATIPVFVYRYLSTSSNKKGQIWFLQGGPGGTGADFAGYFNMYREKYPDWDFYSLDHRGVGHSARLGCSYEDELGGDFTSTPAVRNCVDELEAEWGDGLQFFSSSGAALDLGKLISIMRETGKKVFVYGVSYGTYWGHRYMQLFPNQADGVILDSLCMPGNCYLDDYNYWVNEVGKHLMDHCEEDTTCSSKLSTIADTPWDAVGEIFNQIENGTICSSFNMYDADTLRMVLSYMLMNWSARVMIPPFIYRLNRCTDSDVEVIETMINRIFGSYKTDYLPYNELYSNILYFQVAFSELWKGVTPEEAAELNDTYYFSTNGTVGSATIGQTGLWPAYNEPLALEWADTDIPLLMLNGTLDPQTPLEIALPAKDQFQGENQQFITMPYAPHSVMSTSYTEDSFMDGSTCGRDIIFQFIENPEGELDQSCMDELIPVTFDNNHINQALSYQIMGTMDMWEGRSTKSKPNLKVDIDKVVEKSLIETKRSHYHLFKMINKKLNSFKK